MTVGTSHYNLGQSCSPDFVWAHVTAYNNIYTCKSGPDLNRKLDAVIHWSKCIICLLGHLQIMLFQSFEFPEWHQMMCNGILYYIVQVTLSPAFELSWAELQSFLGWPSVNAVSCAQPRLGMDIFAWCKWPLFLIRKLLFDSKRTCYNTTREFHC